MPTICCATSAGELIAPRFLSGVPMSTAITMSAPRSRATSTGRLSVRPPSTSVRPFTSIGEKRPGAAMLARIATGSEPWSNTTRSPVSRSVAIARNGIARSSNDPAVGTGAVHSCISARNELARTKPLGSLSLPVSSMPADIEIGYSASSSRSDCGRLERRMRSNATSPRFVADTRRSSSSAGKPDAYRPPTTAPMLVPTTMSIGTRSDSSVFSTPMCA